MTLPGLVKWFGGKGNMVRRIKDVLPRGLRLVDPYGGAASVLMSLEQPYPIEVYNDLDDRLINLVRVLRNEAMGDRLIARLEATPYSRAEFIEALRIMNDEPSDDPVINAWAFFVCQNQGVPSARCKSPGDWGRVLTAINWGMAQNVATYSRRVALLGRVCDRVRRWQVDNRCALEVIDYWDGPGAVFYVDPPYVAETRKKGLYAHECDDGHHARLVELLCRIDGSAVVSGYDSEIYSPLDQNGYRRIEFNTSCYAAVRGRNSGLQGSGTAIGKVPRKEVVWILDKTEKCLFGN